MSFLSILSSLELALTIVLPSYLHSYITEVESESVTNWDLSLVPFDPNCENDRSRVAEVTDLALLFGGDGTFLRFNALFGEDDPVPPLMGLKPETSLGFLMPFQLGTDLIGDYALGLLLSLLGEPSEASENQNFGLDIVERMRLYVGLVREEEIEKEWCCVNEVSIHRGMNESPCTLDIRVNETNLPPLRGDGVVISTAAGSTAYSMSCGGPAVHPLSKTIGITCISPQVPLGIAPLVLNDDSVLFVELSKLHSRIPNAEVSFDGIKNLSTEIELGETSLIIREAHHSCHCVVHSDVMGDWIQKMNSKILFSLE